MLKVDALQPAVVVMGHKPPQNGWNRCNASDQEEAPARRRGWSTRRTRGVSRVRHAEAGAYEVLAKEKAGTDLYSALQRGVAAANTILILKEDHDNSDTTPSSDIG